MKTTKVATKTKWSIDQDHSEIGFTVKHLMIARVKGGFKRFDASIYTSGNDFTTAEIDLWIDPSSIDTNNKNRDEHLKSADFFDVQNHKQISFTSSTIGEPDHEGNHELWGELTMTGVTKNIKLNLQFGGIVHDLWGNEKAGFTITGKISRSDWGLVWNTPMEAGGLMVSEEVAIVCEIELKNIGLEDLTLEMDPNSLVKIHQKV
ncbi:MAG: YceI family protein [Bacteroidetes bacterium]|nr:YceI family protein [Bacteroidota bacterium]